MKFTLDQKSSCLWSSYGTMTGTVPDQNLFSMIIRERTLPRSVSRIPFVRRVVTDHSMTLTALLQQGSMDQISPMNETTSLAGTVFGTSFQLSLTTDLILIIVYHVFDLTSVCLRD